MRVYIDKNIIFIATEPKTFQYDLSKDVDKNLQHKINFIIKHNEFLA